ncbi:hypothetical protein [Aggregatilinea lenta]|uniref:hypothetical protein n=1 Tax=Aggregatilinea lenta TaxID=913108 RepID=UPI0013C33296|nr:hypothetical protein [Aggregatilinea lenta]
MTFDNDAPQAQIDAQRQLIKKQVRYLRSYNGLLTLVLLVLVLNIVVILLSKNDRDNFSSHQGATLIGLITYLVVILTYLNKLRRWAWWLAVGSEGLFIVVGCTGIFRAESIGQGFGVLAWIAFNIWILRRLLYIRGLFAPGAVERIKMALAPAPDIPIAPVTPGESGSYLFTDPSQIANTGEDSALDDPDRRT